MAEKTDRRKEQRIRIQESLTVTPLGPPGGPPVTCQTMDMSGSGMSVLSPRPFPAGMLVKLEGTNRLLLAEALRSDPQDESYTIGLKVSHILDNLASLQRLSDEIKGESPRARFELLHK